MRRTPSRPVGLALLVASVVALLNVGFAPPAAADQPNAPTGLTGTPGDGQIELSWTAPADNGGTPVNGYRVEISESSPFASLGPPNDGTCGMGSTATSTATSCTATGLDNGTAYYFRVLAFDGDWDTSAYSSVAGPFVPVPPAPDAPAAPTVVAGDAKIAVAVAEPASGSTPESYLATAEPGGGACTISGSSGSCTIEGLSNGVSHTVSVTATNAGGTSAPSPASVAVTPVAPAPPTTAPPTTRPPATSVPTAPPTLELTLDLTVGTPVSDAANAIGVQAANLVPGSQYTVTMFSAPRRLATGTADVTGVIAATVAIPSDTAPGAHTVTLDAVGPDGPVSVSGWFSVDADGNIAAVSSTGPVPIPAGVDTASRPPGSLAFTGPGDAGVAGVGLSILLGGVALILVGRLREEEVARLRPSAGRLVAPPGSGAPAPRSHPPARGAQLFE